MTDTATLLEDAGTATRVEHAALDYQTHPPTDGRYGVVIDWTWGTSANKDGYLAIKRLVTEQVEQMIPAMIDAAVVALKVKGNVARKKVAQRLNEMV